MMANDGKCCFVWVKFSLIRKLKLPKKYKNVFTMLQKKTRHMVNID